MCFGRGEEHGFAVRWFLSVCVQLPSPVTRTENDPVSSSSLIWSNNFRATFTPREVSAGFAPSLAPRHFGQYFMELDSMIHVGPFRFRMFSESMI